MFVNHKSVRVLVEFALTKLGEAPLDEQIKLYVALAETLPTARERAAAKDISVALSRASALQLDFTGKLKAESRKQKTED